jgi:threonine dehydratase
MTLALKDILLARQRIGSQVRRTPLEPDHTLGQRCNCELYLKLETRQRTGSFKLRGALNHIAALPREQRLKGFVTASSGNHALAVAYAARVFGDVPVTIFVPRNTPQAKLQKLEGFGVAVRTAGKSYESAHHAADAFHAEHNVHYVPAYDDHHVIAGQGTVGLEIMEDLPDVDVIVVPVGGGGLSAGVALAAKTIRPQVTVIGVQPDASPAAALSFRDGHAYEEYEAAPTIADGLAGGYGRVTFEVARDLIDDIVVVKETDIHRAVAGLLELSQELVEGSGATAVAPLLNGQLQLGDRKVVAVLSGRNIDASVVHRILSDVYGRPAR